MIRQFAIIAAVAALGGCEKYVAGPTEWSAEQYIAEDNLTTRPQLPCFDHLGGNAYVPRPTCSDPSWHDDGSLLSRMRNGAETLNTSTGDQKRRRPTAY